jgi:hypothetical protein
MSLKDSRVETWSPAKSTTLGGTENFRRWDLARASRSLGVDPWGCLIPGPSLSLSLLPGHHELNNLAVLHPPHHDGLSVLKL